MNGHGIALGCVGGMIAAACTGSSAFVCTQDAECDQGTCQLDVGYCSFPDVACPSGQRFGAFAGDGLANTCVSEDEGTGSTSGPATTTTSTSSPLPTATATATEPDPTTGEATADPTADSTGEPSCPSSWWDCAWAWRMPLDVTWSGEALDHVPVRVSLSPERIDPSALVLGGADLRVVAGHDGRYALLPHELEWISPEDGRAELWVRVPQLVNGARVWLYWENLAASDAQSPAEVWNAGYAAVWHLGPQLDDALGQNPLDDVGTADAEGRIGRARLLDGTTSALRTAEEGFLPLFEGGGTVSAWIHATGWGQGNYGRIVDNTTSYLNSDGWDLAVAGFGQVHPESLRFAIDYDVSYWSWESGANTLELGRWHHVVATFDTSVVPPEPLMYIDGQPTPVTTGEMGGRTPNLTSPLPVTLGAVATGDERFFDGALDEVRLSSVPRSAAWVEAEHLADTDQLLEYGPPEPAPSP